jgi:outer membrane protein assembly factor BamB
MIELKSTPKLAKLRRSVLVAVVGVALLLLIAVFATSRDEGLHVSAQDWPWWRGLDGSNVARGDAPVEWSATEHVIWKTDLSGHGHGTPIVHSQRVFLASADEQSKVLSLHCFDCQTGAQLWQTELQRGGLMHKSIKNSYASASAACDGQHVYYPWIAENALWLAALDMEGELIWRKRIAPFTPEHGYASSPCVYNSSVIVAGDNLGQSYVTALHRNSGKTLWQTERSSGGSYGSPVVAKLAGRDQLLLSGQNSVVSYNPDNGDVWWRCEGPGPSTIGTLAWHGDLAFATCGAEPMIAGVMAIQADSGRVAWQADAMANVPSPLIVDDRLLVTEDRGTIVCFSAESGQQLWRERLGGNFSASPVLAGDFVYLPNEAGEMFVFRAGLEFELVAKNELADGGFASPVIVGGRIYVRTNHHLYCIGEST